MAVSKKPTLEELNAIMERTGGWLDLRGTAIQQLPDNLTVGGYLDLSGTAIQQLPDNLTVNWLDLSGTAIQQLPDNLTVHWLDLSGTAIRDTSMVKRLKDGDCRPGEWIYADGILTHIKREKQVHTADGDFTFYIGRIPNCHVVYDGTLYAHAATLREGVQDILFKRAKDRGAEVYKQYGRNDRIDTKDAIVMYRIITGACRQGTQQFIDSLPNGLKESYTIREIMEMTKGRYGSETFREFFEE